MSKPPLDMASKESEDLMVFQAQTIFEQVGVGKGVVKPHRGQGSGPAQSVQQRGPRPTVNDGAGSFGLKNQNPSS